MNLLADESVDGPIVEALRQSGHSVTYVAEFTPGIADEEVLREANGRSALLITRAFSVISPHQVRIRPAS